jgi:hypothetical protein
MPNLPISQLPEITATTSNAEYAVSQGGVTYRIKRGYMASGKLFGSFYQEGSQSGFTPNTIIALSASTTADNNDITVVDGSKFTVASGGTFNLQFSAQLQKLQGGSTETMTIWLRKNGLDVDWTSTDVTFANNNQLVVPAWNFVIPLNANDNLQLMCSVTDTEIIAYGLPARTGPVRPGIPSLIVTVVQI